MAPKFNNPRAAEWRRVKGQIIARWGTLVACAHHLECATVSLRACILTDSLPGIRGRLFKALEKPEPVAA